MSGQDLISLVIDEQDVQARPGASLLEAALEAGIYVPHLCHHPDLPVGGFCRLCVVEVEAVDGAAAAEAAVAAEGAAAADGSGAGARSVVASCTTCARDGMVVRTQSEEITRLRRLALELLLVGHPPECGTCEKYLNCELQSLKQYLGVEELRLKRHPRLLPVTSSNPLFVYEPNKCVLCGRCVRACWDMRQVGVLRRRKRDGEFYIYTADDLPLAESGCRFCGACAEVCPTGAVQDKAEQLLGDPNRKKALVPCTNACPAEIDVPRYVRFVKEGDHAAAAAVIREKVPFPGVLGYVCDHPCETGCRRGEVNDAVAIRELKRFAAANDDGSCWKPGATPAESTDKRVAVVGSGPAGLTVAYYLRLQGHDVTVFEALPQAGGMLRYGIPEYRLPRQVLDQEIGEMEGAGVVIETGARVDSLDALFEQGYDAVVLAVGAHKGQKLRLSGANSAGTLVSTDFLRAVHSGAEVPVGKTVTVLGGGNVAFDCARVALRLGAERVQMACLECREEMPAGADEIEQGLGEGIIIMPSHTCTRIASEDGWVTGIEFLDVDSFLFDESGVPQIEAAEGSEHLVETDTIIFAVGQVPEIPEGFGIDTTERRLIELDPYTSTTSREAVFAAGDAVTGTASVIKAVASGRKAAAAVDKFLGGSGRIDRRLAPVVEPQSCLGRREDFAAMTRAAASCVIPEKLVDDFCEVVPGMEEEEALCEAERCLQCDLRLKIQTVKFWGSY